MTISVLEVNQLIGVCTAAITLTTLFFGKKVIALLNIWSGKILAAILYPFNGVDRRLTTMSKDHERLSEKLDFIVDQLKPNSGTSLRDAINRLEKNQRLSDAKMSHYLDTKDTAMFETNEEGLFVWVSKGYESLTGRSSNDLKNWGWTLAIDPLDLERIRSEWQLAISQKRAFETTYRIKPIDGMPIQCSCRAVPTIFNDKIIAWVGVINPVKWGYNGRLS